MNATTNWIQMNYTNIRLKVFFVKISRKGADIKKSRPDRTRLSEIKTMKHWIVSPIIGQFVFVYVKLFE